MNPKTIYITLQKCNLCEVKTSHFHHYYPATRNGHKTGSKTGVHLCPNHHHMANLLQVKIERLIRVRRCTATELDLADFSDVDEIFDEPFRAQLPYFLVGFEMGEREYFTAIGFYNEADYE